MGVADNFRIKSGKSPKKADSPEKAAEQRIEDPFDYFLDGTFPRTIEIDDDGSTLEYIPLTLAEECELKDSIERLKRMLAKALHYRVQNGLDNPEDISPQEYANQFVFNTSRTKLESISYQIEMEINFRISKADALFAEYAEEAKEKYDLPRRETPLENVLGAFMFIDGTSMNLHDMARMTALQYTMYTLCRNEAAVRKSNDHDTISQSIKSAAPSGNTGNSKRRNMVGH